MTTSRKPHHAHPMPITPADAAAPRRRGGQELPDEVQDRPEQNAGYDAAVRGESGEPIESASGADLGAWPDEHRGVRVRRTPDEV